MIEVTKLNSLLEQYNLHFTRQRKKELEEKTTYEEMKEVLQFLIQELNISPSNIEKCPSIL